MQYTQIMYRHMRGIQRDWETWSQMTLRGKSQQTSDGRKGLIKRTSPTVPLPSFPDAPPNALPRILMRNRLSLLHLQISKQRYCCHFCSESKSGFFSTPPRRTQGFESWRKHFRLFLPLYFGKKAPSQNTKGRKARAFGGVLGPATHQKPW